MCEGLIATRVLVKLLPKRCRRWVEILKVRRIKALAQAPVSDDVDAEHELAHSDDPYM